MNEDEDLVKDLVSFYWGEIRKSIVDMRSHNIFVEDLGTFQVKHWKVDELLPEYKHYLETGDFTTFRRFPIKKDLEQKIEKLTRVQEMVAQDQIKKQSIKDKRNEKNT